MARRMTDAESRITQNANSIALKVSTSLYNTEKVYRSNTAPTTLYTNMLWLDTSLSPPILKRYTGSAWIAVGAQELRQGRQQEVLDALHAHGEHLDGQDVVELVHGEPRKGIRLPKDDAAGVQVLRVHDALAVVPGPLELPPPEGLVEPVVGVAGDQPHPDL